MIHSLLQFEIQYQLKQKAFAGFSIIFLAFGWLLGRQGFSLAQVDFNSPYQIAHNISLLTLGCVFAIMFFTISGMLRDKRHDMEAILYSTSIQKPAFFWSRFLGVLLFSVFVFSMALLGFGLAVEVPGLDPERLAPFKIGHYAWVWMCIVLPNVLICTAFVFSVSALTKNNMAIYISAISIYALYWICSIYFNSPLLAKSTPPSPGNMAIAALVDPFGLSAFFEQTQYWTPFQKNNQQFSLSGNFLWNRVIWLSISAIVLLLSYHFFSFKQRNKKIKKAIQAEDENSVKVSYQPISTINISAKGQYSSFLSLLKIELLNVFKSLPFLAILLIWIVIVVTEIYPRINEGGAYNDSLYPTTNFLIWLIKDPFPIISLLLIVFYSGELVWRERGLKLSGIIDATPAANSVFFLSKAVTLLLLPLFLLTVSMIIGLGFQLAEGYYFFEIGQYLSMFYYLGIAFIFYTLFALFVQSIVPNKYVGMAITGLIIIAFGSSFSSFIGIHHPLFRIGSLPSTSYTNMTGYGDTSKPFHHFALYWTVLGLMLALIAFKLWQRGSIRGFAFRWKQFKTNWTQGQRLAWLLLGIVWISSGATIFYNTNIVNDYTTYEDDLDFREGYERKYKQYESLQRLVLVDAVTEMDIYPEKGQFVWKANYVLENSNDAPIEQVLISERYTLQSLALENADLIEYDSFYETHFFQFKEPLLPQEQVKFSFEMVREKKGFETSTAIVNNGSFISTGRFDPVFAYRKGIEIKNNFEREQRGLPKREEEVASDDHMQNDHSRRYKKINFETIVSTQANQTALAPGNLIKQWTQDNRNYFHYKSPLKITPAIAYFSADYKTRKEDHKGISIEQYYETSHDYNIETIQQSTKTALDYCLNNFGAYPFDHIRIAEMPSHWPFGGIALPGLIGMVEDRLYLIDNSDPKGFDLVAKRTIHEVAHQWWGRLLDPKSVEGASIFTEGFAKYTEAVVMEKMYGKRAIWQLSESANSRYFSGRAYAAASEPPVYHAKGEHYLSYGKKYTVMLALKELIGEQMMNEVLKNLLEAHRHDLEPSVIALEFLAELYEIAPPEHHVLIDDWMKRIITYDLKLENAEINQQNDGSYQVILDITAARFEIQETGEALPIKINEPIPIGLFTEHPRYVEDSTSILYLAPHQIDENNKQITITVDKRPQYIAIDPFGTRSDQNRGDNLMEVDF